MSASNYSEIILRHSSPLEPVATELQPQLQRVSGIRAVLFDVYGTLLISASGDIGANAGDHRQAALENTCQTFGLSLDVVSAAGVNCLVDEIASVHAREKAQGIEYPEVDIVEIWRTVLPKIVADKVLDIDFSQFSVEYEVGVNPVWPMPAAAETLELLAQRGLVLGIVSNAQFFTPLNFPPLLGKGLEEFGFSPDLMYFSYEHQQAKPGNYLYQQASEQLESKGVAPGEVLYVGNDMLNDVMAASSVGFRTALFAGDRRSLRIREGDPRVLGVKPDVVVTELMQLSECLPD